MESIPKITESRRMSTMQHFQIDAKPYQKQLDRTNYICPIKKVRKRAKIRNRYNQAPHLTLDTNGKVTTPQLDITNESQEVSPFPAIDRKASINRHTRKHNKKQDRNNIKMIHKRLSFKLIEPIFHLH